MLQNLKGSVLKSIRSDAEALPSSAYGIAEIITSRGAYAPVSYTHLWRNRPLQSFYPFAFVDCIYVPLRTEYGVQQVAVDVYKRQL